MCAAQVLEHIQNTDRSQSFKNGSTNLPQGEQKDINNPSGELLIGTSVDPVGKNSCLKTNKFFKNFKSLKKVIEKKSPLKIFSEQENRSKYNVKFGRKSECCEATIFYVLFSV